MERNEFLQMFKIKVRIIIKKIIQKNSLEINNFWISKNQKLYLESKGYSVDTLDYSTDGILFWVTKITW